ncbi:MAG: hypothetical protein K2V71_00555 [Methylotenera sp.]|nr:hypothetical protein [Methylotenera sp.]OQW69604.1 MAG: hypothetical protein BVN34_04665 [Proteobacteria bacterium ST_bin12]PPD18014.1 MAG: hypothetical protein CTY27_02670 [Methylotenera sp.]
MLSKFAKLFKILILTIIIPIALFALYTWAALSWVYSTGERAGYVQKFSEKGYVCKTYEGELVLVSMPGTQAEKFFFTVKDKTLVEKINNSLGKRVRLTYEEHKGIPSTCFGETPYYVQNVQVLEKDDFNLPYQ